MFAAEVCGKDGRESGRKKISWRALKTSRMRSEAVKSSNMNREALKSNNVS